MKNKGMWDDVEGEEVARQANRNRECTQIAANLCERDHLDPLPTDRNSEHLRPLASIRGRVHSVPSVGGGELGLLRLATGHCSLATNFVVQVVDFHDRFRYFWVLRCFQWNRNPTRPAEVLGCGSEGHVFQGRCRRKFFSISFFFLGRGTAAAGSPGASLQAGSPKWLLMRIYSTENSEEPKIICLAHGERSKAWA